MEEIVISNFCEELKGLSQGKLSNFKLNCVMNSKETVDNFWQILLIWLYLDYKKTKMLWLKVVNSSILFWFTYTCKFLFLHVHASCYTCDREGENWYVCVSLRHTLCVYMFVYKYVCLCHTLCVCICVWVCVRACVK